MRQAIMRPSRSLVRAGGGALPNNVDQRSRRSSLPRVRSVSTSAMILLSVGLFMIEFAYSGGLRAAGWPAGSGSWDGPAITRPFVLASLGADDAIHPLAIALLRDEGEAELLSDCAGEEAPHRVLLPPGLLHDGRDRCALRATQHRDHVGLLGIGASPRRFGFPALSWAGGRVGGLTPFRRRSGRLLGRFRQTRRFVLDLYSLKA